MAHADLRQGHTDY